MSTDIDTVVVGITQTQATEADGSIFMKKGHWWLDYRTHEQRAIRGQALEIMDLDLGTMQSQLPEMTATLQEVRDGHRIYDLKFHKSSWYGRTSDIGNTCQLSCPIVRDLPEGHWPNVFKRGYSQVTGTLSRKPQQTEDNDTTQPGSTSGQYTLHLTRPWLMMLACRFQIWRRSPARRH